MEGENTEVTKRQVNVFVTYAWEDQTFQEEVISFTNHLRSEGFNASMDLEKSQEETAIDFSRMMHDCINNYDKIIIILTKKYKEKAEANMGGVSFEYNLIINDFKTNPKKYILLSFQGIDDSIIPLFFKGKEIIDFTKRNIAIKSLYSKLMDEKILEFSPVGEKLPEIYKDKIKEFNINSLNNNFKESVFVETELNLKEQNDYEIRKKLIETKLALESQIEKIINAWSSQYNEYTSIRIGQVNTIDNLKIRIKLVFKTNTIEINQLLLQILMLKLKDINSSFILMKKNFTDTL